MNVTEIKGLLAEFWQQTSDACPLECGEAEKQETAFAEFVESKFKGWEFKDAASFAMKYLAENHNPMTMAEIDQSRAILYESQKTHGTEEFVVD